jgi:hypothetical protein
MTKFGGVRLQRPHKLTMGQVRKFIHGICYLEVGVALECQQPHLMLLHLHLLNLKSLSLMIHLIFFLGGMITKEYIVVFNLF